MKRIHRSLAGACAWHSAPARAALAILALAAAASMPIAAKAANARHPYANVDHRVDAGNDTGDAEVEALNQSQLTGTPAMGAYWPRAYQMVPGVARIYPGASAQRPAYPAPPSAYPWPSASNPEAPGQYPY